MSDRIIETREWFREAAPTYRERSPLYAHLAAAIADDPAILRLAVSPSHQPPHILFAAVHYLLLAGKEHPLGEYYASLSDTPLSPDQAWPLFRRFCVEHEEEIQSLVRSRIVQTNEVTRCSSLYLVFGQIARAIGGRPLSLIEVGASAGLNLLFDRYAYLYAEGPGEISAAVGNSSSTVRIKAELRGEQRPIIPSLPPSILFRCGIDLNPIDPDDPEEMLWLRSLIWPEQRERVELLTQAVALVRQEKPMLIRGNALGHLADCAAEAPDDSALCVYHTHTLHTWSEKDRERLTDLLNEIAGDRELYRVSVEWFSGATPKLELTSWNEGKPKKEMLACCDDHGRWIEWRSPAVR